MYLLNSKDDAMCMFIIYKAEIENQLNKNIKILKFVRGGEYESNEFSELCAKFSIIYQTTSPYNPIKLQHHILLSRMGLLNKRIEL